MSVIYKGYKGMVINDYFWLLILKKEKLMYDWLLIFKISWCDIIIYCILFDLRVKVVLYFLGL